MHLSAQINREIKTILWIFFYYLKIICISKAFFLKCDLHRKNLRNHINLWFLSFLLDFSVQYIFFNLFSWPDFAFYPTPLRRHLGNRSSGGKQSGNKGEENDRQRKRLPSLSVEPFPSFSPLFLFLLYPIVPWGMTLSYYDFNRNNCNILSQWVLEFSLIT